MSAEIRFFVCHCSSDAGTNHAQIVKKREHSAKTRSVRVFSFRISLGGLLLRKISVGVCAYNEQQNIGGLLLNLLTQQGLEADSEIIVVCSGCTDSTPGIVKRFSDVDSRVKLITEEKRLGKASAINNILSEAKGQFIFLIPADVSPEAATLPLMIKRISENPRIGVVGGSPVPTNDESGFCGYLSHLMWRLHNNTMHYLNDLSLNNHASGEFMVLRRGIVDKIPLNVVNDDAYIAVTASLKGFLVKYCDKAKVRIKAPTSIPDYICQRRRVVYGHLRVKELTKEYPKTIENMLIQDPSKSLHILIKEIKERPKDTAKMSVVIIVEAVANALALIDILLGKQHTVWTIAKSTKNFGGFF